MATRALANDGESIANNETYVSSNLGNVRALLPRINDGTGGTVAVDAEIRVEAVGSGHVELLTNAGRRVGFVPARSQAVVVAQAGQVEGVADSWNLELRSQTPAAFQTISASPSQAEVTALRDCLVNAGLMKAE